MQLQQAQFGNDEEALRLIDQAISANPDDPSNYNHRGLLLKKLGKLKEALLSYDKAIQLKSDYAEAFNRRGNIFRELKQLDLALQNYEQAIQLQPNYVNAYHNKGVVLQEQGRINKALESYEQAIQLNPSFATAIWHSSHALLFNKAFKEGWQRFEARWEAQSSKSPKPTSTQPLWLGEEDIEGKTLLIHTEQGFGDSLQFCRYINCIKQKGGKVVILTESALANIFLSLKYLTPEDKILMRGETLPWFDFHCPMMSLPLALKLFSETSVRGEIPYLFAEQEKIAFWRNKLGRKIKPRIGLVWNAGFRPNQPEVWAINARRNIDFRLIAQFHSFTQFDFYSLQKGEPAESELLQIKNQYWKTNNLHILTDEIHDWTDTAGLIYHLDLLISVDTSIAHLAGAMGKSVWLLNRFDTCWRWLLEGEDSYLYPNLRIFRQPSPGDWKGVIREVKQKLEQMSF